jgi:ADP-heptose:LPS heptosyltransferase
MKKIIISRTDSIGDVILTLPVCGVLKEHFPDAEIYFLGKSYTADIVRNCKHINEFINYDEILKLSDQDQIGFLKKISADAIIHVFPVKHIAQLAKKAGIQLRIGASGRIYHYLTCNRIIRMSRRRSDLHESQLNLKLLSGLGLDIFLQTEEISAYYGWKSAQNLREDIASLLDPQRFNIILHPRSKGSAREWGIHNFARFAQLLLENEFKIFVTGTADEGKQIKDLFELCPTIINLTGKLSLSELISFISRSNGLIAASTGPLHMAAASGIIAIGIYPPIKPMHPGRWKPIGKQAVALVKDQICDDCRKQNSCHCMEEISPEYVLKTLNELQYARNK